MDGGGEVVDLLLRGVPGAHPAHFEISHFSLFRAHAFFTPEKCRYDWANKSAVFTKSTNFPIAFCIVLFYVKVCLLRRENVTPTQDTIYTITVTGPGGTAMASVTVKMLAGHLQSVWDGMKIAMLAGNIDQVIGSFSAQIHDRYLAKVTSIASQLPEIAQEMREIEPIYFEEFGAKYRIKRLEVIEGVTYDITYYIYFVQEEDGSWKILNY